MCGTFQTWISNDPTVLCFFPCLPCSLQAVRLRHFEPRPTPTLRHRWGESSLSLLWRGAKKTWAWLRGRSSLQLSTSPSSEPLETRRALCLLRRVQGPPLYLDRQPFRSENMWSWIIALFCVKDSHSYAVNYITCYVSYHPCFPHLFLYRRLSVCLIHSSLSYPVSF